MTLSRPPANALNTELIDAIFDVTNRLSQEEYPPVLLLTAQGDRFFSAGGDIKELENISVDQASIRMGKFHDMLSQLACYPSPVVSAVKGYAAGGGLELTLASDVVVAGENAKLGFPEINNGLIPALVSIRAAIDVIGKRATFRLLSTGRFLTGQEAFEMGLVDKVVPDSEVTCTATDIAKELAQKDPSIRKVMKGFVRADGPTDPAEIKRKNVAEFEKILSGSSSVEARQRFLSKKKS